MGAGTMSRKDSKGMFAAVLGQLNEDQSTSAETTALRSSSPHLLKVAAGVKQMQERSELADKLLKEGEHIVELDPDTILPSTIPDRYDTAYDAAAIIELMESMRERGQIVPGLVRPAPGKSGLFQIVYGRRRLAAAKKLGLKFKAAVRELTDEQAIIFQGEENTSREDLSFIEKCLFALAQQDAGFKRETICASLSTGKSHVSEMIKISTSIPKHILFAIGKAPGIGRGRWEDLARRFAVRGNAEKAAELVKKGRFLEAASDDRFNLLFSTLPTTAEGDESRPRPKAVASSWAPEDRTVTVKVKDDGKIATMAIGAADGPRFAAFITERLDDLYEAFRNSDRKQ